MTRIYYLHAAVTNIDTSGIIAFEELERILKKRNIQVILQIPSFF